MTASSFVGPPGDGGKIIGASAPLARARRSRLRRFQRALRGSGPRLIRLIVLPVFALVLKGIDCMPHLGEGGVIVFLTWFMILMSVNLLTSSFSRHSASRSPRKVGFSQTLTEPVSSIWNGCDIWSH